MLKFHFVTILVLVGSLGYSVGIEQLVWRPWQDVSDDIAISYTDPIQGAPEKSSVTWRFKNNGMKDIAWFEYEFNDADGHEKGGIYYTMQTGQVRGGWLEVGYAPLPISNFVITHVYYPGEKSTSGRTPLTAAIRRHASLDTIQGLLRAGENPNAVDDGFSPLELVLSLWKGPDSPKLVDLLLDAGADPDFRVSYPGDPQIYTSYDYALVNPAIAGSPVIARLKGQKQAAPAEPVPPSQGSVSEPGKSEGQGPSAHEAIQNVTSVINGLSSIVNGIGGVPSNNEGQTSTEGYGTIVFRNPSSETWGYTIEYETNKKIDVSSIEIPPGTKSIKFVANKKFKIFAVSYSGKSKEFTLAPGQTITISTIIW